MTEDEYKKSLDNYCRKSDQIDTTIRSKLKISLVKWMPKAQLIVPVQGANEYPMLETDVFMQGHTLPECVTVINKQIEDMMKIK